MKFLFFIFEVFRKEIFNIMLYFFKVKSGIPSVTGQNNSKYLHFNVVEGHFCCLTNFYFFRCFSLFWLPSPPRISNFQPESLLWIFWPSKHFDQKKLRFWYFTIWFGTKATNIGDFGHLNSMLGTIIRPNKLIFRKQIEKKYLGNFVL